MTSLTYMTQIFLFIFMNSIDLSKEGCLDHLDVKTWGGKLKDTFSVLTNKDLKVTVMCTLKSECGKGIKIACDLLNDCFQTFLPQPNVSNTSQECKGENVTVYYYNFMCLTAEAANFPVEGCEYNTMCKMWNVRAESASPHTTDNMQKMLPVSLVFNMLGPLAVYLYMRRQRMRDRKQWTLTNGDQPKTELDALPASANNKEIELLIQGNQV